MRIITPNGKNPFKKGGKYIFKKRFTGSYYSITDEGRAIKIESDAEYGREDGGNGWNLSVEDDDNFLDTGYWETHDITPVKTKKEAIDYFYRMVRIYNW